MCQPPPLLYCLITDAFPSLFLCTKCQTALLLFSKKWLTEPQHVQSMNVHGASDVANEWNDRSESHSRRVSDLPVHSLERRVQVLLHVEERGSSGWFLYGVRQRHDPAIISKPLLALNKFSERCTLKNSWTNQCQWHRWGVWHVGWDYLLHFQNAVLQNVLIGQGYRRPLPYIQTLVFQITRLHVFRQFYRGWDCDNDK